ncbi:MAG: hypothetical protein EBU88_05115, partial [Acidobacteria bacterium]|nr:hypothetical protein [Acidobacteriota bacterium]
MGKHWISKTSAERGTPGSEGRFKAGRVLGAIGILLVTTCLVGLGTVFYLRSVRFNRTAVGFIQARLREYGLRVEVGRLSFSFSPQAAQLERVRILNETNGQLIATIDRLMIAADLRDPLSLRRQQVIRLQQVQVDGLTFHLEFGQNGPQSQSNLDGLRIPPRSFSALEFDQNGLKVGISRSRFQLRDNRSGFAFGLGDLTVSGQVTENDGLTFDVAGAEGLFQFDGRDSNIDRLRLEGTARADGVSIKSLRLDSALGQVDGQGRVSSWTPFGYEIDLKAAGDLGEAARLFAVPATLKGKAHCQCRLAGSGSDFTLSGLTSSNQATIGTVGLENVTLDAATLRQTGGRLEFETREVTAARILIGNVQLDRASVSRPRISFAAGRSSIESSYGSVASVEWPRAKLSGLELTSLKAQLRADRYQVTSKAWLSEGSIAGIPIRGAQAAATLDGEVLSLDELVAQVDQGSITAALSIPLTATSPYRVQGDFSQLPTNRILSLLSRDPTNNVLPVTGTFSGEASLEWRSGDSTSIAGTISARLNGESAGSTGGIPISGNIQATVGTGSFTFPVFELRTGRSTIRLGGSVAVTGQSDLRVSVESTLAQELVTIARGVDFLQPFLDRYPPHLPGILNLQGVLRGDIFRPLLAGNLQVDPVGLHQVEVASLTGEIRLSADEISLTNGVLAGREGESGRIDLLIPFDHQSTSGRLNTKFDRLNVTAILAILEPTGQFGLADLIDGRLAGEANLSGLPGRIDGSIALRMIDGTIVRQPIKSASSTISFADHRANLDSFNLRLPQTTLQATGFWNLADDSFAITGQTNNISLSLLAEAIEFKPIDIDGAAEISFRLGGEPRSGSLNGQTRETLDWERLSFTLSAITNGLQLNRRPAGDFRILAGTNATGRLRAALSSRGPVEKELFFATIELKDRRLPITISGELDGIELAPFVAIVAPERAEILRGQVSGSVSVSGPTRNEAGDPSIDQLRGDLIIRQLDLDVGGNRLRLAAPESIVLTRSVVTLPAVRLLGSGVELVANGQFGLTGKSPLTLAVRGEFDLGRLTGLDPTMTASGRVQLEAQADGTVAKPILSGALDIGNLGLSSSELPFFISNGNGLITLAGDELRIKSFRATANDGRLDALGSISLNGLRPEEWRIELKVDRSELYFQEISSSLSAALTLSGTPAGQTISGTVKTTRLEFDSSLDLDNLIAGGEPGVNLNFDPGAFRIFGGVSPAEIGGRPSTPTRLDLRLEARDTLAIRGEQFNAVGTALLNLTGTIRDPVVTGRLESDSGFVRFRGQRYDLSRATLDLLPGNGGAVLNLTAESDFRGYRVSLGLAGQVDSIETTLRSEPALSRDEIISLITTGRTEMGALSSQDPLRSGFGTAASFLTTGLISRPTEQLLGLSRFQIDPIIRPNANPAARLTVGQQLSRNLYVSYSTNLATEQDQTALAEYTFTSRFSALATYSQGGSSTRQGLDENVFTIELRGRQRFALGFTPVAPVTPATGPLPTTSSPPTTADRMAPSARVSVPASERLGLKEGRLRELLPVSSRGFSRSLARLGERRLREYLQEQGYFFAEVNFRCEPVDCSGEAPQIFYDVEPNRVFDLTEIRIEGSTRLQIGNFRGELQSETASRVGGIPFFRDLPLVGGSMRGLTSNERLKSDEETIRRTLVEQGYLTARVNSRLAIRPESD